MKINVPKQMSWRVFPIAKKTKGKVRFIHEPCPPLKTEQRRALKLLYAEPELAPSRAACGFVPGRSAMTGLKLHDPNAQVIIKLDVKKFFDTFPTDVTAQRMVKVGIPATDVADLMKICIHENMFAQGAPTSPALTNIGMLEVDSIIRAIADKHGFTYSRYADDICLCSTKKYTEHLVRVRHRRNDPKYRPSQLGLIERINKTLKLRLGLRINPAKTAVIWISSSKKSRRVTGVNIRKDGEGYNASRRFRYRARAEVHTLYKALQTRRPYAADYAQFFHILGEVAYMDMVRSFSETENAKAADPVIKEKEFTFLLTTLKKGKKNENRSARCTAGTRAR